MSNPNCNHDTAAVHNGICECGEIIGPCTGCGSAEVVTEVNYEATCAGCADDYGVAGETLALERIASVLRSAGHHKNATTLAEIAAIVRETGRATESAAVAAGEAGG